MKKQFLAGIVLAGSFALAANGVDGAYVHPKCKAMTPAKTNMPAKANMQKMKKHKQNAPFLITHGLPHLTKKIKMHWNDPRLNLTAEQKAKLLEIRKATLGTIKTLKPQIMQLQKEIVAAARAGESADALAPKVEKLAKLKAEATMAHLRCLEKTKAVLNKDQIFYLMSEKKMMKKGMMKQGQKGMKQMPKAAMKCAPGKCGHAK